MWLGVNVLQMKLLCALFCGVTLACCGGSQGSQESVDAASQPNSDANLASVDAAAAAVDAATSEATDFAVAGPFRVGETPGTITTEGCQLAYTLFSPAGATSAPLVILGHGFSRGQAQMAGIARHIASFGSRVATPQFCHSSAFDTDHPQNGRDAAALGQALAAGSDVLYAGQSAGGLAAVLAASLDANAVAILGLDLVDADGLAASTAANMAMPVFAMVGEPAQCNSNNNGVAVVQGAQQWAARVTGATHCDFEDPTNGLCTAFCGGDGGGLPTIRTLAAAFVSWQFGLDASGEAWSSPTGSEFQRLVGEGILSSVSP